MNHNPLLHKRTGICICIAWISAGFCCSASHAADKISAAQQMQNLENIFQRAGRFDIHADVVSDGHRPAKLDVNFGVANPNTVVFRVKGEFDGKPISDVSFRSDGVVTMVTIAGRDQRLQPGRNIRQAAQISFLRLGLFPNMMRFLTELPLEHESSGIEKWVVLDDIHYVNSPVANAIGIAYKIKINDKIAGNATLILSQAGTTPIQRDQELTLDGNLIKTHEVYSRVTYTPQ